MSELVFEVMQEGEGDFSAKAIGGGIFTRSNIWNASRAKIEDAMDA